KCTTTPPPPTAQGSPVAVERTWVRLAVSVELEDGPVKLMYCAGAVDSLKVAPSPCRTMPSSPTTQTSPAVRPNTARAAWIPWVQAVDQPEASWRCRSPLVSTDQATPPAADSETQ